jgi:peptidoglycan L-alanyl-D-glutamate endopeptidase CwlK
MPRIWICLCIIFFSHKVFADIAIQRLQEVYPDNIQNITHHYITWKDGSRMLLKGPINLIDQWAAHLYHVDLSLGTVSLLDLERDMCEPFFKKMYGNTAANVQKHLVTVYWLSKIYGKKYPLRITSINGVAEKVKRISEALENLPPKFHKYVMKPASSFYWRKVAKEKYLSLHSFGIAIDINIDYSNYWLWDWIKAKKNGTKPKYQNHIPSEIVAIFEKEGFAWGGKWYHYDTMHFEYRPELFV